MLTADSIESCYRTCTSLMLCKKYARLLEDERSPLATLARNVLTIDLPKRAHWLIRPFVCLSDFTPKHLRSRQSTTKLLRVGLRVEVDYFAMIVIKADRPNGTRGKLTTPVRDSRNNIVFGPSQYVMARIREVDPEARRYTLVFEDGPYSAGDGPRLSRNKNPQLFGVGTEFVGVDHAFIGVELAETIETSVPYFLLSISAVQLFLFFYYW